MQADIVINLETLPREVLEATRPNNDTHEIAFVWAPVEPWGAKLREDLFLYLHWGL